MKNDIKIGLDRRVARLATAKGFNEAFEDELRRSRTNELAYEATEDLRVKYFGERAYASYDSFRTCRNRMLKKKPKI